MLTFSNCRITIEVFLKAYLMLIALLQLQMQKKNGRATLVDGNYTCCVSKVESIFISSQLKATTFLVFIFHTSPLPYYPTSPLIPHHYIPNPHHTNGNNNYCLLPAVASTTSESTAHNKYNHKLTKEITNQSPRAINKNLDPCWPYKDQGKTSVDKNPVG